jgi:hypothetical protein
LTLPPHDQPHRLVAQVSKPAVSPISKSAGVEIPDTLCLCKTRGFANFENAARLALGMKLFEMGRLTSGQAAQLAGISRIAFLFACPQWNVPAVN